jgi:molybdate transport repressor ModE-like protein
MKSRPYRDVPWALSVRDLVLFEAIAREGSISAAARALGVPRGRASRHLQELEALVGVTLLERTTRTQRLTAEGALVLDGAREVLEALDGTFGELQARRREPRGVLRVSAPQLLGQVIMGRVSALLLARHPGLELEVELSNRREPLLGSRFDVALTVGPLPDDGDHGVVASRVGSARLRVYTSPTSSAPRPERPEDLERTPTLTLRQRTFRFVRPADGEAVTVRPARARLQTSDAVVLCELVERGVGAGVLPELAARTRDALEPALPGWEVEPAPIWALYLSGSRRAPRVRALIDAAREVLGDQAQA